MNERYVTSIEPNFERAITLIQLLKIMEESYMARDLQMTPPADCRAGQCYAGSLGTDRQDHARSRRMRTAPNMVIRLGDLVVAAFDKAACHSNDPKEVSRLATQTVMYLLQAAQRELAPLASAPLASQAAASESKALENPTLSGGS